MNRCISVLLTVTLVHDAMTCIILLQNSAAQDGYDLDSDYSLDESDQRSSYENQAPDEPIRDKRRTEDLEDELEGTANLRGPLQYCSRILRNNVLHPFGKRLRQAKRGKRHKRGKLLTPKPLTNKTLRISTTSLNTCTVHEENNKTWPSSNSSNTEETLVATPSMEVEVPLRQKNGHLTMKAKKQCVHNQRHQKSGPNHHKHMEHPSRPTTELSVDDDGQTIIYEVYERKINTDVKPTANPHIGTAHLPSNVNMQYVNSHIGTARPPSNVNKEYGAEEASTEIQSEIETVESDDVHQKPKDVGKNVKNVGQHRGLQNVKNFTKPNVKMLANETQRKSLVSKEKKILDEESQEIDLFTPIKELEIFLATMRKDNYASYLDQHWKAMIFLCLILFILLFCCLYSCIVSRLKAKNDATLFLVNPVMDSASASAVNQKPRRKDRSNVSIMRVIGGDSDSDDYTVHGRIRGYRKFKRDYLAEKRDREEGRSLLKSKFVMDRYPPQTQDVFSYREDSSYKDKILRQEMSMDPEFCFYSNKEIKELYKQDPKHVYHFSSIDGRLCKPYRHESNVESYAETVTSSANSRFIVERPNNKKLHILKKKGHR